MTIASQRTALPLSQLCHKLLLVSKSETTLFLPKWHLLTQKTKSKVLSLASKLVQNQSAALFQAWFSPHPQGETSCHAHTPARCPGRPALPLPASEGFCPCLPPHLCKPPPSSTQIHLPSTQVPSHLLLYLLNHVRISRLHCPRPRSLSF